MGPTEGRTEFRIGEQASMMRTVTEGDVDAFAALSGDFNPLHVDRAFAARSRFGRRIAHGMFTAGLISAVLGNDLPGPGAIYLSQQINFLAPVFIGDTIRILVEVTGWRADKRIVTLRTDGFNQDGTQVVSGEAVFLYEPPSSGGP
jgi:3-hydroxybutyryl-CoA dehydratase